jgi:hypothetical protein
VPFAAEPHREILRFAQDDKTSRWFRGLFQSVELTDSAQAKACATKSGWFRKLLVQIQRPVQHQFQFRALRQIQFLPQA